MKLTPFMKTTGAKATALVIAVVLTVAASSNWNTTIVKTDRAYQVGNEAAEVTLTEFVSYTCPHCATFTKQGEAPLQLAYIGPGKLKLEVRSIIRNNVDLAATMLVQCGDESNFLKNHTMFMARQDTWLNIARNATRAQQDAWSNNTPTARRNIASALGFYEMMETRGYARTDANKCLNDQAKVATLIDNTEADYAEFGIRGTPSFAIDGETLDGIHGWQALEPELNSRF
ncbi:thioredoxin domain-containing protein [Altererythrobacter sp. RZ02]|uniref:Thioredoxin domain-containing protein n=1 Tax=Pontixanthobacter rizhaonensis TaxID=2730337 RepID=A0A848QGV9_9SPHN|nr:thioredoxin domain-containing protein [Pontixanthobacter rizhaonensis]NMW31852.1 thioredoxin domain-containing protein [Pontixanthobacter rizhaonensis]